MEYTSEQLAKINDASRIAMLLNRSNVIADGIMRRLVMTSSVADMEVEKIEELFNTVSRFNTFNTDNDPHCEHDFGSVSPWNELFYFKFDYYDSEMEGFGHSNHVMTIMHASDY